MTRRLRTIALLTSVASLAVSAGLASEAATAAATKAPAKPVHHAAKRRAHRPIGARLPLRNDQGEIEENEETGASAPSGSSTDYMLYRGGWVQESPRIDVVYWGDWSTSNDTYNVQNQLWYFVRGIGGSAWARTLLGYGYNCTVGGMSCSSNSVMSSNQAGQFRNYWKDTSYVPQTPARGDLQAEAQRAAAHFGDYSHNVQYVIALPPGHGDYRFITKVANGGVCAWHDWAPVSYGDRGVSYTSLPYMPDAGYGRCGNNSVNGILDGVTIVEGHEYAESVTNPYISYSGATTYEGWDDSTLGSGEIGDKCMGVGGYTNMTFSTGTFPVQTLWSNYGRYYFNNGCVFSS